MDVGFITKSNKILVSLFFCKYLVRIDSAFALSKTINIRAQQGRGFGGGFVWRIF